MMPPWLVQWAFTGLVLVIMWFLVRTLRQVDKNQAELFTRLNTMEKEFYKQIGECRVRHGRRSDDETH